MEQQESRPRVAVIVSVPASVLLGVLFFMPWLGVSCDAQAFVEMSQMAEMAGGVKMERAPTQFNGQAQVAEATGAQLAAGEVTPVGLFATADPPSGDQGLESRGWVYAGLVLPAALLAVCAMSLTGKLAAPRAGKYMFFLAFAGVAMMYTVSRISYVDDIVDKARRQYEAHIPAGARVPACVRANIEQSLDQMAAQLEEGIHTEPTTALWVAMGVYAAVCVCGLVTMGSPTPASERAIAERSAKVPRRDHARGSPAPRPAFRERRTRSSGQLPQFGPDLFPPSDRSA